MSETTKNWWLPTWWDWVDGIGTDWRRCQACLEYNHTPCVSCELPPGILGIVCLVGGGTATIAGNMRGNVAIHSPKQAKAASRVSGVSRVTKQLERQRNSTRDININARLQQNRNQR